jgi:hypothetical protein
MCHPGDLLSWPTRHIFTRFLTSENIPGEPVHEGSGDTSSTLDANWDVVLAALVSEGAPDNCKKNDDLELV